MPTNESKPGVDWDDPAMLSLPTLPTHLSDLLRWIYQKTRNRFLHWPASFDTLRQAQAFLDILLPYAREKWPEIGDLRITVSFDHGSLVLTLSDPGILLINTQSNDHPIARDRADWSDDDGPVLWWLWPIREPPYVGTPDDDDFPDYVTHWTPLVCPVGIAAPTPTPDRENPR